MTFISPRKVQTKDPFPSKMSFSGTDIKLCQGASKICVALGQTFIPTAYFNFGVSLDQLFSPTTYFNFGVSLDQTFNPTAYFNFGVSLSIQQHISTLVSLLTRLFFIPTTYLKCLPNMLSGTWEDQCYLPLPLSRCHQSPDLSFCIDFCTVWVCNALLSGAPKHHLDTLQQLQNKTLFISQSVL